MNYKYYNILMAVFMIALQLIFNACNDDRLELEKAIRYVNKQCPIKQQHWTIDSVKIGREGEIEYYCNSDDNAEYFLILKEKKDSIANSIIDNINHSKTADSQKLVRLCKKNNAPIIYKYHSNITTELCIIKIPVEKLIVDPEKMD